MIAALATGIVFGLSAGLAPGPLMAYVMAETLRRNRRAGILAAFAPLATDVPIVLFALAIVGGVAGSSHAVLGVVALLGAGFVAYLAVDTVRAASSGPTPHESRPGGTGSNPLVRGAMVNATSPHPYLFWLTVGAPALIAAWAEGPWSAVAFLGGFYGCLVGAKVALAVTTSAARNRIAGRGYRIVMVVLGAVLGVFAIGLLLEATSLLAPGV